MSVGGAASTGSNTWDRLHEGCSSTGSSRLHDRACAALRACKPAMMCRLLEKEQQKLELLQLQEAQAASAASAAAIAAETHRQALRKQLDLQTQMAAAAHLRAAEKEEQQAAAQQALAAERQYMQRVAQAEAQVAPRAYFGRKKVDWYY